MKLSVGASNSKAAQCPTVLGFQAAISMLEADAYLPLLNGIVIIDGARIGYIFAVSQMSSGQAQAVACRSFINRMNIFGHTSIYQHGHADAVNVQGVELCLAQLGPLRLGRLILRSI